MRDRVFAFSFLAIFTAMGGCKKQPAAPRPQTMTEESRQKTHRASGPAWANRLWPSETRVAFVPTRSQERQIATDLIPRLLNGQATHLPADTGGTLQDAGLQIVRWSDNDDRIWALLESEDTRRGSGAYLFSGRPAPSPRQRELVLAAPHAFFDEQTGIIAGSIFFAHVATDPRMRAFFTNTLHRYRDRPGKAIPHDDSAADVCHNPQHLFSAVTEAAARLAPMTFVQIHGFGSAQTRSADVIVSAGNKKASTPRARAVAAGLARILESSVTVFPEETSELGATTNVQGQLLAKIPGAEFVHIEMSMPIRQRLVQDPNLLGRLGVQLMEDATRTLP
jgi:hypothetical protein